MADFAVIQALRGIDDFGAKRAAKERQLNYLNQLQTLESQRIQEQQAAQDKIAEYMSEVGQLKIMEPDKQRVNELDNKLRSQLYESLKQAGGDTRKWLLTGGSIALKKYQNDLMSSPEVKQALKNSLNYNRWQKDRESGLDIAPVSYVDNEGDLHIDKEMEQAYQDYVDGKSKSLEYNGGAKPLNITDAYTFFAAHPKDPNNPYTAMPVTGEDLNLWGQSQGAKPWQTQKLINYYSNNIKANPNNKFYWGKEKYDYSDALAARKLYNLTHYGTEDGPAPETNIIGNYLSFLYDKKDLSDKANSKGFFQVNNQSFADALNGAAMDKEYQQGMWGDTKIYGARVSKIMYKPGPTPDQSLIVVKYANGEERPLTAAGAVALLQHFGNKEERAIIQQEISDYSTDKKFDIMKYATAHGTRMTTRHGYGTIQGAPTDVALGNGTLSGAEDMVYSSTYGWVPQSQVNEYASDPKHQTFWNQRLDVDIASDYGVKKEDWEKLPAEEKASVRYEYMMANLEKYFHK